MSWEAERTQEFDEWWKELTDSEQRKVVAILLIGGDKAGKSKRFYKRMVPVADRIYDSHLEWQGRGRRDKTEGQKDERQEQNEEQTVRRSKR